MRIPAVAVALGVSGLLLGGCLNLNNQAAVTDATPTPATSETPNPSGETMKSGSYTVEPVSAKDDDATLQKELDDTMVEADFNVLVK